MLLDFNINDESINNLFGDILELSKKVVSVLQSPSSLLQTSFNLQLIDAVKVVFEENLAKQLGNPLLLKKHRLKTPRF